MARIKPPSLRLLVEQWRSLAYTVSKPVEEERFDAGVMPSTRVLRFLFSSITISHPSDDLNQNEFDGGGGGCFSFDFFFISFVENMSIYTCLYPHDVVS